MVEFTEAGSQGKDPDDSPLHCVAFGTGHLVNVLFGMFLISGFLLSFLFKLQEYLFFSFVFSLLKASSGS